MKKIPFFVILISGILYFSYQTKKQENCLFYNKNKCYTCDEPDIFFVGLPEVCQFCPNKKAYYMESNGLSFWACLPQNFDIEKDELPTPKLFSKNNCSPDKPLMDILGHCHSCESIFPVQTDQNIQNICPNKRYLTKFRNSSKSNLCPELSQIQEPEFCLACRGKWHEGKCVKNPFTKMVFCFQNSDCKKNEYCHPLHYIIDDKKGICAPQENQKWFCSKSEGYTNEDAQVFCQRQNAHIPSINELILEKDEVLSVCQSNNIWIHFDEGTLHLESLKTDIITQEKLSTIYGGDKTHALCRQN